jgi:hypothetical protein
MLRLTLSLAALLAAVLPATAEAGFQINRSMQGVRLEMTRDAVRERRGAPARRELGPDLVNWRYRRPAMEVTFTPRVITLFTRSAFVRGPRDIGVGTSERRLKSVVDGCAASPPKASGSASSGASTPGGAARSSLCVAAR